MNARGWVVLVAALLSVAGTARLGWWQLDRAGQKLALQDARDLQGRLPPLRAGELARNDEDAQAQWHRRATVDGRWLSEATVYLENRPMKGQPGFVVVTPLLLDDGAAVVVQRGWLPRDASDRTRIAPYRTDPGRVQLSGRIAPTASRLYQLGPAASGPIRQNLDVAGHARNIGRTLLPLVVIQDDTDGAAADGLVRQWPLPASDVHKHYGYAVQWFALSALVIALYAWFQLIRPRRAARR